MDGTPDGGLDEHGADGTGAPSPDAGLADGADGGDGADGAPTAPQPPLTPEALAALAATAEHHHHARTGHAHAAPGGVAPHPQPHHAAPVPPSPSSGQRRALLAVGATVAALAVAGGAMAFAAGRSAQPEAPTAFAPSTTTASGDVAAAPPSAEEAPGVTAAEPMLAPAQDTLVLGDSLGLTVYPWLADLLPDRYVSYEAQVGRTTPATYQALRSLGSIPPVVLVSSGTNDYSAAAFEQDVTRTLDLLGPERCVVWVDVVRPERDWSPQGDMNAALDRAVAGRTNVSVLRWTELLDQNPGWLGGDGIHPGREGAEGRARAFAASSLACSPLDPDAPVARKQYIDPTAFQGPIAGGNGTSPPSATTTTTRSAPATQAPSATQSPSGSLPPSPSDATSSSEAPSTSAPPQTTSAPPPTTSEPPPPVTTTAAAAG